MSDLRTFERWCEQKLTRLQGKPITSDVAVEALKVRGALDSLKDYHGTVAQQATRKTQKREETR